MYCKQCGVFFPGHGDKCPSCKASEQPSNQSSSRTVLDWRLLLSTHKRLVIIVCCILAAVLFFSVFSVSSNENYAPDQLIRDDIAKKFGTANLSYSVDHSMDETTHIDTVTVRVVRERAYSKEHYIGTLQYRYNKANDTWDNYGNTTWRTDKFEFLAYKFTKSWRGSFQNTGGSFSVNITSVDFDKGTITGTFSASRTTISLGGSQHTYTLNASGTYPIEKTTDVHDGYSLTLYQDGMHFYFELDPYYGFQGIAAS